MRVLIGFGEFTVLKLAALFEAVLLGPPFSAVLFRPETASTFGKQSCDAYSDLVPFLLELCAL